MESQIRIDAKKHSFREIEKIWKKEQVEIDKLQLKITNLQKKCQTHFRVRNHWLKIRAKKRDLHQNHQRCRKWIIKR